jgi:3,4-dihydroxy 2-butanone 4-phosphate synthase
MSALERFGSNFMERIENAVNALRYGRGILLVDDEDRENEGDLIYSAEKITEQDMALMIRECSGIVCLCLTEDKCRKLGLRQMVEHNTNKHGTAFTISIEARNGVTTGVSAKDRLTTIKAAIKDGATGDDLAYPGHIFPLVSRKGGVFERRGHTEGSVDLMKIANIGDTAVLCELTNIDGTMAQLPDIIAFAVRHDLTVVTIEDIYQYRKFINQK